MERNLSPKYKGVRKRKWGKWVSEIRLPNSRERIWLGSFDSPEKAARAFDAALYCLRGPGAVFNFPDNLPEIPGGQSLSPREIQAIANKFANEEIFPQPHGNCARGEMNSSRGDNTDDVSGGGGSSEQVDNESGGNTTVDWSFLGTLDTDAGPAGFGYFPDDVRGENDLYRPYGIYDDVGENGDEDYSHHSFLWNF